MKIETDLRADLFSVCAKLDAIVASIKEINTTLEKPKESNIPKEHSERLAELEVKMLKLWGLLTEETPQGKTKLSKQGRSYKDWLGDPKI